jgi:hypothetical protein
MIPASPTRVESMSVIRSDKELIDYVVLSTAGNLASAIFGRPFAYLSREQQGELLEACGEFVDAQINEHAPAADELFPEPCAMSAAKDEAEA